MAAVIAEICEWAEGLPYWEQVALDRVLAGSTLSEEDFDELLSYLLEDEQLVERKSTRPQLRFITSKGKGEGPTTGKVRLLSISKLRNVNTLAENQKLTFGPALTIIYGANCSGKSGYARVLGVAGFTRGDCEILPDVITSGVESAPQVAQIEIEDDFGFRSLSYDLCNPSSELSSVYVFDSTREG